MFNPRVRRIQPWLLAGSFLAGTAVGAGAVLLITRRDSDAVSTSVLPSRILTRHEADILNEVCRYGIPSPSTDLIIREGFVLSFDRRLRNPAWVCQHLTPRHLQKAPGVTRDHEAFKEDPLIPEPFRPRLADYFMSGYDRGHMAPARDNSFEKKAMSDSFYLSNISPQVGIGFNRHYWSRMEKFVRDLVKSHPDVYVVTGPLFLPQSAPVEKRRGSKSNNLLESSEKNAIALNNSPNPDGSTGHNDTASRRKVVTYPVIGESNIAVPTHFFKVVLATDPSEAHFAVAAFVVPNARIDAEANIGSFVWSLEELEKASGLVFFEKIRGRPVDYMCVKDVCVLPQVTFEKSQEGNH